LDLNFGDGLENMKDKSLLRKPLAPEPDPPLGDVNYGCLGPEFLINQCRLIAGHVEERR